MLARKSDLARFADSADSFALVSATSAFFMSVMSVWMLTKPPFAVALSVVRIQRPSARRTTNEPVSLRR